MRSYAGIIRGNHPPGSRADLSIARPLLAAIEKAEDKSAELLAASPDSKVTFKLLAGLNKVAALYLRQIVDGLAGDPRAAAKARVILRELFCGEIRVQPQADGGSLAR